MEFFVDGAVVNSKQPNGYIGVGIYSEKYEKSICISYNVLQQKNLLPTNNVAELYAMYFILKKIWEDGIYKACIISDSLYAIGTCKNIFTYHNSGRLDPNHSNALANLAVILDLYDLLNKIGPNKISFRHTKGHSKDHETGDGKGNFIADLLATFAVACFRKHDETKKISNKYLTKTNRPIIHIQFIYSL
jgi:ribonuclease HI